ncbi:MAG: hypothetical protein WAM05_07145 [Candidatus Binataceae bacterium]
MLQLVIACSKARPARFLFPPGARGSQYFNDEVMTWWRPVWNDTSDFSRSPRKKSELVSSSAILNEIKTFSDLVIKNSRSEPTVETMFDRRKCPRSTRPGDRRIVCPAETGQISIE